MVHIGVEFQELRVLCTRRKDHNMLGFLFWGPRVLETPVYLTGMILGHGIWLQLHDSSENSEK